MPRLPFALCLAALMATAHAADNSPLTHLTFQRSLRAGDRDANGKLITGTEIDFLVPHQGRLYASNCLWMETDSSIPKACQILALNSPKGPWRVEREFTVNSVMMRCSVLKEITFATDGRGQAIAPVALLLAVPDAPRGPLKVFCRDDATGNWSPSVTGTATGSSIRAMGLHRDKVTGIDRIFAGSNRGVLSGVYEPAVPGRLRWDQSAEVEAPAGERVMGFCDCRGKFYCATSRHIYQRADGAAPAWKDVYFCPKEIPPCGLRGLSAVPKPGGSGEVLWFTALGKVRQLDPADGFKETIELDLAVFLTDKLGVKVGYTLSAYNDLLPCTVSGHGEKLWLFGFECSHPAWVLNAHPNIKARAQIRDKPPLRCAGNGRYCIRHAKGANLTYEVAEITDPREPQLVSTRTIARSPFPEDQGRVLYFGGYDCNGVPSHNTAWIYRGELPPTAPSNKAL
jgi:poly(A) polymerase